MSVRSYLTAPNIFGPPSSSPDSYSQYIRRLHDRAQEGLDLFRVYLVEPVKDACALKRDAQGWASYLMSEHTIDRV